MVVQHLLSRILSPHVSLSLLMHMIGDIGPHIATEDQARTLAYRLATLFDRSHDLDSGEVYVLLWQVHEGMQPHAKDAFELALARIFKSQLQRVTDPAEAEWLLQAQPAFIASKLPQEADDIPF